MKYNKQELLIQKRKERYHVNTVMKLLDVYNTATKMNQTNIGFWNERVAPLTKNLRIDSSTPRDDIAHLGIISLLERILKESQHQN